MDRLKDGRKQKFFMVENDLIYRKDIDIYERAVYITLSCFANNKDDTAFPSYQTIADLSGMSKSKAIRCIQSLEDKKLIKKEIRKKGNSNENTSNLYTILSASNVDEGSVQDTPPSVRGTLPPSVQDTPPSVRGTPELYLYNNTNLNNNNIVGQPDRTQKLSSFDDKKENDKKRKEVIQEVLTYLNEKTNKEFKLTTHKYVTLIATLLEKGYTLDDMKKVIDIKCTWWLDDAENNKYLRPSTLFGNKFDEYLNEMPKSRTSTTRKNNTDKKEPWKDFNQTKYPPEFFESLYVNTKPEFYGEQKNKT